MKFERAMLLVLLKRELITQSEFDKAVKYIQRIYDNQYKHPIQ